MSMLQVGAAKVSINPTQEMFPYPSYQPGNPYVGIYTNCFVRAIAIDNGAQQALLVGYDLGGVPYPEEQKKHLSEATGIPVSNILLSAIHNHTGCDIVFSPDPEDQKKAEAYRRYVCGKAVDCAKQAVAKKRHARYGYGIGSSYVNINRDMHCEDGTFTQGPEYEGYCDHTVYLLKFVDDRDQLIAAYVSYGMHATLGYFEVDADGKTRCSGNIPGVAEEYAEERFGNDCVVLWTSAAAGDQNPYLYTLRDYEPDGFAAMARLLPGSQYQLMKLLGKQHGVDICKTINRIDRYNENMPIRFGDARIPLPAQKVPENFDPQQVNDWANHIERLPEGKKMPVPLPDPDHAVPLYVEQAVLGDVAIVGVGAEIYSLIGKAIREVSPYRKTMVVTHVTDSIGYIIDSTSVDHYCFEQYGRVRAGACDGLITEGVRQLFDRMQEV